MRCNCFCHDHLQLIFQETCVICDCNKEYKKCPNCGDDIWIDEYEFCQVCGEVFKTLNKRKD